MHRQLCRQMYQVQFQTIQPGHHDPSGYILPFFKSKDIESIFCILKLFIIINGSNSSFALRNVDVVINISADEALGTETTVTDTIIIGLEELVEDVVRTLNLLLFSNTGLFKQVGDNVATRKLS